MKDSEITMVTEDVSETSFEAYSDYLLGVAFLMTTFVAGKR